MDGRDEALRPRAGDRRRTSGWCGPRKGDRHGNLVFNKSARNFNPLGAMAGRVTVAEVEELVEPGELDPDQVHLPGIYVQRVLPLDADQAAEKRIERRTVRPRPTTEPSTEQEA